MTNAELVKQLESLSDSELRQLYNAFAKPKRAGKRLYYVYNIATDTIANADVFETKKEAVERCKKCGFTQSNIISK